MVVLTLIGDVVQSRTILNRPVFQQQLEAVLAEINREHPDLLSPYTITLGDEFQAVYRAADRLFHDIFHLLTAVFPHRIRFAIAVGRLDTPINPRQAIGMDGPAFHLCREGISHLKQSDSLFYLTSEAGNWQLANQTLALISHELSSWNRNRWMIMNALLNGTAPRAIAEQLNISTVAVYKNIRAGALEIIQNILSEIAREINQQMQRP
jgi:hypothetical protein